MESNKSESGIIYQALNTENNMSYIGQTTMGLTKRKHGGYNRYFSNVIKKYGDSIKWIVLEEVSVEKLDELERHYIKKLNTIYPNGYNFESGGNKNKKYSSASRKKCQMRIEERRCQMRIKENCQKG